MKQMVLCIVSVPREASLHEPLFLFIKTAGWLTHACALVRYVSLTILRCPRLQVWEETAAKHVKITEQLSAVAAVATRWRRLELASWRTLLQRVVSKHQAGAYKSWFYLYCLLIKGMQVVPEDDEHANPDQAADAAFTDISKLAPVEGGGAASVNDGAALEKQYRFVAMTLEHFLQTSTIGEFAVRLQLLDTFQRHLEVQGRLQGRRAVSGLAMDVAVAVLNNTRRYYGQFLPDIEQVRLTLANAIVPVHKYTPGVPDTALRWIEDQSS